MLLCKRIELLEKIGKKQNGCKSLSQKLDKRPKMYMLLSFRKIRYSLLD